MYRHYKSCVAPTQDVKFANSFFVQHLFRLCYFKISFSPTQCRRWCLTLKLFLSPVNNDTVTWVLCEWWTTQGGVAVIASCYHRSPWCKCLHTCTLTVHALKVYSTRPFGPHTVILAAKLPTLKCRAVTLYSLFFAHVSMNGWWKTWCRLILCMTEFLFLKKVHS